MNVNIYLSKHAPWVGELKTRHTSTKSRCHWVGLGTARGGCAVPGTGCGAVSLHHAENESQNESGNLLILKIEKEVLYMNSNLGQYRMGKS